MTKGNNKLGQYSFMTGILLAIIIGFIHISNEVKMVVTIILVVLGFVVGFLNISQKETTPFLVAAIALMVAGNANYLIIPTVGVTLQNVLHFIVTFVAPAGIIVALKQVRELANG